MVYGSWSRGYKTGGWTTRLSNPLPTAPNFGPEKAETFELGVKSQFLDHRLQLNGAVFTTDYKGIQLNFQQGVSPTIQNAGDATIRGFELEAVLAPVRAFTLTGSVGYLDAHYRSVLGPAQVAPAGGVFGDAGVVPGATLPKTPDWKFNVSPRFEQELNGHGTLILIGDYTYTARLKNDTEGYFLLQRAATNVVNATLTYREPKERWDISVGGTNITDDRYLVTGQAQLAGGQAYGTYSRPAEWFARLGREVLVNNRAAARPPRSRGEDACPRLPRTEFWHDIKPIEKVFREGALPEIYASKIAEGDERYWVPISETVSSKPVWISPSKNMWADVLMSKSAGLVNRHYHSHPIWAYTISGKWAYLEHDWTATAGRLRL